MELIIAFPFIVIPLFFPFTAGAMARNFGRPFWPWFIVAIPLPIITHIILLCLPDKSVTVEPINKVKVIPIDYERLN